MSKIYDQNREITEFLLIGKVDDFNELYKNMVSNRRDKIPCFTERNGLQYGDKELKLPGNNSQEVQDLFAKIEPHYQTIKKAVYSILKLNSINLTQLSPNSPMVQDIVKHSPLYLRWMDRTVFQFNMIKRLRNGLIFSNALKHIS